MTQMKEQSLQDRRISGVLSRVETILDTENAAIGVDAGFDFKQSNANKSRCLYDMTMLFRDISLDDLNDAQRNHLKTVRAKLEINNLKVRAHMEAVRSITEMIKQTVTASEADGTYSEDQFRAYDLS